MEALFEAVLEEANMGQIIESDFEDPVAGASDVSSISSGTKVDGDQSSVITDESTVCEKMVKSTDEERGMGKGVHFVTSGVASISKVSFLFGDSFSHPYICSEPGLLGACQRPG
jgi:hypothetical protein